ncbi:hypothetical protein CDL15_Pgr003824 [Punica granatum]|uniref:Uncharacterized protein n=1 Tax=Punica granatum TaxID=22663 RepID=A0A218XVV6_PUNGR|nr:hypothetical protein CDL15_Pgr003824 [Punica granatum]
MGNVYVWLLSFFFLIALLLIIVFQVLPETTPDRCKQGIQHAQMGEKTTAVQARMLDLPALAVRLLVDLQCAGQS